VAIVVQTTFCEVRPTVLLRRSRPQTYRPLHRSAMVPAPVRRAVDAARKDPPPGFPRSGNGPVQTAIKYEPVRTPRMLARQSRRRLRARGDRRCRLGGLPDSRQGFTYALEFRRHR